MHSKNNVVWHSGSVSREERSLRYGHRPRMVLLTGLSGSGKSTLACEVERRLWLDRAFVVVLDGDNLRHGLCRGLGFSAEDRTENLRRAGEVARLFVDQGAIVLAAFVSPTDSDRATLFAPTEPQDRFLVHVATPLVECERRDPKGLYARARSGEIANFTGISAPFEPPQKADFTAGLLPFEEDAAQLVELLRV